MKKENKKSQQRIYNNKGVNTLSWVLYHLLPYCIYTKLLPLSLKKDSATPKTKTSWLTKLREKIKLKIKFMILNFANKLQDLNLRTFHIEIKFKTNEKIPTHFKLELLAELRDEIELGCLETQIHGQLSPIFNGYSTNTREITLNYEKDRIIERFIDDTKKCVPMKFIFRQWVRVFSETNPMGFEIIKVIDKTIPDNGIKDYRVNILKTGNIPFSSIKDMFCVEIETNKLK